MFPPPGRGHVICVTGDLVAATTTTLRAPTRLLFTDEFDFESIDLADVSLLHLDASDLYEPETRRTFWNRVDSATRQSIPISLDVGSPSGLETYGFARFRTAIERILPAVLICNGEEGQLIGINVSYPKQVPVVVHHFDEAPTRVLMRGGDEWDVPWPDGVRFGSDLGVREVFAGGFLVGWMSGRSLRSSIELGHEVARDTVGIDKPPVLDLDWHITAQAS